MNIDRSLVLHIASLARIELTEPEVQMFQSQLSTILEYINKLNEIEETAEPYTFRTELDSFRSDDPAPSLPVDEALKNAPDRSNNLFRVPRILP
jgi:aspartyl-tRNA(Asn)/glutamyl-tRNA(Gln) amidotransferase subunit C